MHFSYSSDPVLLLVFSSASSAIHISWSQPVCVNLDVNQGGTDCNHCTQRPVE